MADSNDIIGGTVIQRSFVGRGLVEVINVASVPVAEITRVAPDEGDENFLRRLTAEVLGVPQATILDEDQYKKFRGTFLSSPRGALRRFPHPFWDELYFDWLEFARDRDRFPHAEHPIHAFFEDIVSLIGSRANSSSISLGWPLPLDMARLSSLLNEQGLDGAIDDDAITSALACMQAGLTASPKVKQFASSMLSYDIPLGQSPAASSDSLLKLLETGKKMCLAPLAAGGAIGIGQLGTGSYAAALLTVGTGSAMTLVLLGTVAVGYLLVNRVAQQRLTTPPPDTKQRRRRQ